MLGLLDYRKNNNPDYLGQFQNHDDLTRLLIDSLILSTITYKIALIAHKEKQTWNVLRYFPIECFFKITKSIIFKY